MKLKQLIMGSYRSRRNLFWDITHSSHFVFWF